MKPTAKATTRRALMRATWADLLGGEFDRGKTADYDAALWSRERFPDGSTKMILADDFFVPGDRPNFLLSMNLTKEDERLDAGETTARLFNPRAQDFSDGRSPM